MHWYGNIKLLLKLENLIKKPHILYFLSVMIFGTFLAVLNPLDQESDGDMHFYRASDVSYGNVLGPFCVINHDPMIEEIPGNFDKYPFWVLTADQNEAPEYNRKLKKVETTWETSEYFDPRTYSSFYYYPQAFGLVVARILHTSAYGATIWAHMMNLLAYALITAWAVKLMPIYKNIFMASCMMPMCVYLAASFSADALLNAACFLFIAAVFRYAYDDKKQNLGIKEMLPLGILLWFIYTNKYVYAVLGLLVFLIPREKFGDKKNYWKTFGVALAPIVAYIIFQIARGAFVPQYNLLDVLGQTKEDAGTDGTLFPGMTQKEFVMAYPFEFVKVLVRTIYCGLTDWPIGANTFGWMKVGMEPITYWLPIIYILILLFDAGQKENGEKINPKMWHKVLMGVTSLVLICAVISSIYIFDEAANIVGWAKARGIQGRYFLVLVPLLCIGLVPQKIESKSKNLPYKVLTVMSLVLALTVYIFYKHYYAFGILNFY